MLLCRQCQNGGIIPAPYSSESFSQTRGKGLSGAFSFSPLFSLAEKIRIHFGLVSQVLGNGTVDFFQMKQLEVLADSFRRLATVERVDDRIQGNTSAGNVVGSVTLLNVFLGYASLILLR